jgi:ribosomal protein S18 acetylase RimI-like enzyme
MSPDHSTIRLVDAFDGVELDHVRDLFRGYAAEFASWITESLSLQGFDAELTGLPGRYASPGGCLILALDGDRPAGCVALRDLGGGTCEMKRLYVIPEYRKRGAGRLLVAEVLRRAELAGQGRMVLDTLPEMSGAIRLYRTFGFEEIAPYWDNPVARALYLGKALGGDGRAS